MSALRTLRRNMLANRIGARKRLRLFWHGGERRIAQRRRDRMAAKPRPIPGWMPRAKLRRWEKEHPGKRA